MKTTFLAGRRSGQENILYVQLQSCHTPFQLYYRLRLYYTLCTFTPYITYNSHALKIELKIPNTVHDILVTIDAIEALQLVTSIHEIST
jgi:hypothetical protein